MLPSLQGCVPYPEAPSEQTMTDYVDKASSSVRKHGAVGLECAFERSRVHALARAFDDEFGGISRDEVKKSCLRVGAERYMFTVRLTEPFLEPGVYAAPAVFPVVQALLGPAAILQSFGVVCAYPGARLQHIHRDVPELFPELEQLGMLLPPYAVTVVVPLIDLDEATGSTAIWEGTHRRLSPPRTGERSLEGSAIFFPRRGDCYIMDARVEHAGTANTSSVPRPILYMTYSRPWFRDEVNYAHQEPLLIEKAALDRVPEGLRRLFVAATVQG